MTLLLALAAACPGLIPTVRGAQGQASDENQSHTQANANPQTDHGPIPLLRLARHGQFDVMLNRLNNRYPDPNNRPDMRQLVRDLRRYQTHHKQNLHQRRKAYQSALKKVNEALEGDRLEEAMVEAIQAHDLADNRPKFLEMPTIRNLVDKTQAKAKQARQDTDWVQSLTLYRLLHLLYEKQGRYRDQVERARRHVRVLGLYAPKVLRKLYKQQAERRAAQEKAQDKAQEKNNPDASNASDQTKGKDDKSTGTESKKAQPSDNGPNQSHIDDSQSGNQPSGKEGPETPSRDEPGQLDPLDQSQIPDTQTDSWQKRLRGVTRPMLEKTLRWGATKQVSQLGYQPLLLGAIENVDILLQTKGLEQTFPSLKQQPSVRRFQRYLDRTAAGLKRPDQKINRVNAESVIDRILAMNKATVNLPDRVMIYEMAEGVTGELDHFTSVIWPYDLRQFARSTRGNFKGVGIKIRGSDLGIEVVSPLEDTPAQKAGIKAGDVIVSVNGEDARTWSLNRAVNQITGPAGSEVTLGIERDGKKLKFTMARAQISIQSIRGWKHRPGGGWNYWIDRGDRIGYVRLSQFLPQTADDLDKAVHGMQKSGSINGLILDLRFNPGGLLKSAISVSDRFLKHGPIVSTVDGDGRRNLIERAHRLSTYNDFPVVVLINQGSASASEIVSGALQDYDRALIIGNRSFGKGSVQDLFALGNRQARLKLTRQYYKLPDGRIIHRKPGSKVWGIEPDLHVRMSDQQVAKSLELRQKADVLRSHSGASKKQAEANAQGQAKASRAEQHANARDILSEGVDPQLETALLVLQTHLVADHLAKTRQKGTLDADTQAKRSNPDAQRSH